MVQAGKIVEKILEQREKIVFLQGQNLDLSLACGELKTALKQCIKIMKDMHGHEGFEIYYNKAPEMRLIRKVWPKYDS